jgi:hypothetical protein
LNNDILPIPKLYSDDMKILVENLLKKDANIRPSIHEILSLEGIITKTSQLELQMNNYDSYNNSPNPNEIEINNNNFFNLKFDNLLTNNDNNIDLNKDENNNSIQTDIEYNQENNTSRIKMNFQSKIFQKDSRPVHKKYSPSYGINDFNNILQSIKNGNKSNQENKHLKVPNSELSLNKNQFSYPELLSKKNNNVNITGNGNSPSEKLSTEDSKNI